MIHVDPGDENPAADALNGVYEKHRQMKNGDRVVDLGAHKGYFASVALEKIGPTGKLICFEPHPGNFAALMRRVVDPRAILVCAAAWDKSELIDLWESVDNSGGHSWVHVGAGQKEQPIKVEATNIGVMLAVWGFGRPDFMKIDTELAEGRILASLFKHRVRPKYIALEVHNQEMWDTCTALLEQNGYHMTPCSFTNYYLYAWL